MYFWFLLLYFQIVFSCDLGDGNPFRVQSLMPTKYSLCDNKWHNISALYDYEQIALRIDQMPATIAVSQQRTTGKVQTKSPLYIGGIPGKTGKLLKSWNLWNSHWNGKRSLKLWEKQNQKICPSRDFVNSKCSAEMCSKNIFESHF